jgi:Mor family transcriptional regulator
MDTNQHQSFIIFESLYEAIASGASIEEVMNNYGGDSIYIPTANFLSRQKRDERIVELARRGAGIGAIRQTIKAEYDERLTANRVRTILNDRFYRRARENAS